MRIAFIGTVKMSCALLETLIGIGYPPVAVFGRSSSTFNSDFASLDDVCSAASIPYRTTRDINSQETIEEIIGFHPDVVFCFGWSQLIRDRLLAVPPLGIIGYHPALLPKHRGRHPVIWALVLGLKETGSTFFFMDGGADSGDIVSQRRVPILDSDDAGSLYERLMIIAKEQLTEFVPALADGCASRRKQDPAAATSWRKRGVADGRIDWRMSSCAILNLVRALASPYPGATVRIGATDHVVRQVIMADGVLEPGLEPGKVLKREGRTITVKTGDGAVLVVDHDLAELPEEGTYL